MTNDEQRKRAAMNEAERAKLETEIREEHAQRRYREAAELAIRGYGREWYGYLVGILRSHAEADEAFSQLSIDLLNGLPGFEWRSSIRTWAYVLARHAASDLGKRNARDAAHHEPLSSAEDQAALVQTARTLTTQWRKTSVKDAFRDLRRGLPEEEDQTILILRVDRAQQSPAPVHFSLSFTVAPS
jgi:RNA polymerase sigma-70 factor (ECF subfamily)